MEQIKILRLKSGDDIVAFIEEVDDHYIVRDPMIVTVMTAPRSARQTIVMSEWMPLPILKENSTFIRVSDVLATFEPSDAFTEYFANSVNELKEREAGNDLPNESDLIEQSEIALLEESQLAREINQLH